MLVAARVAGPALALNPPAGDSPLAEKAMRDPALYVSSDYDRADLLGGALGLARVADLAALGLAGDRGFVDRRTGSWGTLLPSVPLVPGAGKGNTLTWAALGAPAPVGADQLEEATWSAFATWLTANAAVLRVPAAELGTRTLTAPPGGEIVQIHVAQTVGGVPVRGAFLSAVVNNGNLVLMGTRNWGAVSVSTTPAVSQSAAVAAAETYVGRGFSTYWSAPALELVPVAVGADPSAIAVGSGLGHRLVWAIGPQLSGDHGTWEVLVDAHSGDVVAFTDTNHYATKSVRGGVFPLSNDGIGVEGQEQPGYPMPFADVTTDGGELFFTDSGGDLACSAAGTGIRTALSGRYVSIFDNCGAIDEHAADPDDLDLGSGPGTDCAVPPGSSPGNTHSARTGFYEVNRIKEIARGWLPDNAWLNGQITANMNIDANCNAFWNGSTINFYTSGGGCRNTGEIAAVFDHEWGHGMDANDANPSISAPGEAYADVAAVLRLNDSCVGRGFDDLDLPCGGDGDDCTVCSGVRDVDWAKRASGQPHDLDWINSPTFVAPGGCLGGIFIPTQQGPCGFGTHCEGNVASEAVWDLFKRDLPAFAGAGFAIDDGTAQELVTRLYYLGGGALGNWYNCNPAAPPGLHGDGCNADGAYLNFLAVDDDNGDLGDGTPHMPAFFAAFDRHQMACASPAPVAAASCTRPTTAPDLTVTPTHKGAELSWAAVPGASKYRVYRGDGVLACSFGKERVAEVTGTSFVDSGVAHDLPASYAVMAVGSSDACVGPASACVTATPVDGASLLFTDEAPALVELTGGDGDVFIDNCESGTVSFVVRNDGTVSLTNVRVAHVEPLSHPEIEITSTPTFATALPACGEAAGSFGFTAHGLAFNDDVVFRVDVTADEIAPRVVSTTARFIAAESNFAPVASRTWSFPEDLEDWQVQQGTFAHNPGLGGNASLGYLESSKLQDETCDQVASPLVRLTDSSTLSLYNQFAIEPGEESAVGFYDRANVGLQDVAAGTRNAVSPDGGRLYNASGPNGACVTAGQAGWAGAGPGFLESTWSASALNPGGAATGRVVRLDVAYGTDPLVSLAGIQFDEVTLTDFEEQVPDDQTDECPVERTCGSLDDADRAVEYKRGWHRKSAAGASGGGYHVRVGGGNGASPTARVVFSGDEITYHYAKSGVGGSADVYLDGALVETVSFAGAGDPTFGHSRTYSGLADGSHELVVEHRSGAAYVDGFEVCSTPGGGADSLAATSHSETTTDTVSGSEGALIVRQLAVGDDAEHVSVVVEGSPVPLTVRLLDPLGNLLATGGALLDGLAVSGLDAVPAGAGSYRLEIVNTAGPLAKLQISTARTVTAP
jgi:hypothetical protein